MSLVIVHPRIMERHPDLSENDVREAWDNYVRMMMRKEEQTIAIGFDSQGRAIEMVAKRSGGDYLIYHALTPPTEKALRELGMVRR